VTDYFLNEDVLRKLHSRAIKGARPRRADDGLSVDPRFPVIDFNTAFPTGPERRTGGMK